MWNLHFDTKGKKNTSNIGAFDYGNEYVIFEWMVVSCLIESWIILMGQHCKLLYIMVRNGHMIIKLLPMRKTSALYLQDKEHK